MKAETKQAVAVSSQAQNHFLGIISLSKFTKEKKAVKMYLTCSSCDTKHPNCRHWYKHLISEKHQTVAKESIHNCSSEMNYRSLICSEFNQDNIKTLVFYENDFITYFGNHGLVHDIYFKKRPLKGGETIITACLVLMDSVEAAKLIKNDWKNALQPSTDRFRAVVGSLNRRCEISPFSFQKVMRDAVEELFIIRHHELVEICEELGLEQQFYEFICATSLSKEDILKRDLFLHELESILKMEYPNCTCQPYGSYVIGVGDRDADLDIFVDIGMDLKKSTDQKNMDAANGKDGRFSLEEVFENVLMRIRINNLIQQHPDNTRERGRKRFRTIIPIQARVPIIRLIHADTELRCDISFNSKASVHNSNLMKFFTQYDPRVRPLMMFLRYWGRYHGLLGSNVIKTYGLMLLVVVYLNQQKILPSVIFLQQMQEDLEPLIVDGWNVSFANNVQVVRQSVEETGFAPVPISFYENEFSCIDILKLASGFFEFFGTMDYETFFICSIRGIPAEKSIFLNEETFLETELTCSFEKVKPFRHNTPMCVQDPFLLDFNVTSNVTHKLLKRFTSICRESGKFMDEIFSQSNTNMKVNLFSKLFLTVEDLVSSPTKNKKYAKTRQLVEVTTSHNNNNGMVVDETLPTVVASNSNVQEFQMEPQHSKSSNQFPVSSGYSNFDNNVSDFTNDDVPPQLHENIPIAINNNNYSNQSNLYSGRKFNFPICQEFKELFMNILSTCGDNPGPLENRMKMLWITSIGDFFNNIFNKSFDLLVTRIKIPTLAISDFNKMNNMQADGPPTNPKSLPYSIVVSVNDDQFEIQTMLPPAAANNNVLKRKLSDPYLQDQEKLEIKKRGKEDFANDDYDDDDDIDTVMTEPTTVSIQNVTFTIPPQIPTSTPVIQTPSEGSSSNSNENIMIHKFSVPVQSVSESYSKLPNGHRKSFSLQLAIEGTASSFIGREPRHFARVLLSQKKSDLLSLNTLQMEESATKIFKRVNSSKINGQTRVSFQCNISVDTNEPRAIIQFIEERSPNGDHFPVLHLFESMGLESMVHHYTMFRLKKTLLKN